MGENIWVFSHDAEPPDGNWTNPYELFKVLHERGHKITVFCSSFSHHTRTDRRIQSRLKWKEQLFGGVRFIFIKTVPYFDNGWRRYLNYITFAVRALRLGLLMKEKPDVIIGATPQPLCAFVAYIIARRKRIKFFLEVSDLWPQFFVEIGAFSERHPVTLALRLLEKTLYRNAEKILTFWPRMHLYIQRYGVYLDKIVWIPMGINCEGLSDSKLTSHTVGDNFLVMYRGRFGMTQNMSVILHAAQIIQNRGLKEISFLFVGEGPERDKLELKTKRLVLDNVQFRNFLPKDQMKKDLAQADLLIGSLPDLHHFQKYGMISTKLLDYLSARRPVIFTTNIQDHLVKKSGAGFVVPPDNPTALAEAIIKIASMSQEEREVMGANGVKYIKENHDVRLLATRLESIL